MIRFAAPWMLVIAVPALLLVVWRLRSLPRDHTGARRRVVQALMLLATASAGAALAGLEWGSRVDRMAVVFVLDRSRSVERAGDGGATRAMAEIHRALPTMRTSDEAGLVVFGAEATTEVVPATRPAFGPTRASVPRDATDIAGGIRRALADLPAEHAGRIVLVSDGVETRGDALAAASLAAGRGVPIDVLAIERAPAPEVAVESVRVPERVDPREPVELRVVTRATQDTDALVHVSRDGVEIAQTRTHIHAGQDVLTLRDAIEDPGVHRYDVVIDPVNAALDSSRENDEGAAFLRVTGGARALVLTDHLDQSEALADAIRRTGIEVDLRDRTGVPADLATLASYDLVVLSELNARAFTHDGLVNVQQFVRDLGGGLLMVGTQDAFGLGGYAYTPVEEALPATFDLRNRRDRASLSMVIAIDQSGSMGAPAGGGATKLDVANEAAARSASLLSPFDRVGVAHIDTDVHWTVHLTNVNDASQIATQVRRAQVGGGGILVDTALEASYRALRGESTQLKHLLLFSDGSDSEEMTDARRLVGSAASDRITTSIVSMGNGPDTPELERLSRIGGGRFYIVEDMSELPRIFTEETIQASRSAIVDRAFVPIPGADAPPTRGIDLGHAPPLGGYVVMNQRPRAQRLAGATREDPLLLEWQYGIGKSATFACDTGSRFAQTWLGWDGYPKLFGQLARDLVRAPERSDAHVSVTLEGGVGHVRVEAVDTSGHYRNYLDLHTSVAVPGGAPVEVTLTQTGAGRYEGTFDADAPGAYLATVSETGTGLLGSVGVVHEAGDELRGEGTDRAKLAQIAALSGGRVLHDLRTTFTDRPPPIYAHAPLWPLCVIVSLLSLLLSVALRRLVLPDLATLVARLPTPIRNALGTRAARPIGRSPEATLDALSAARARGRDRTEGGTIAPEVARALAAQDAGGSDSKREAKKGDDDAPPPPPPAAPPSSLAEQLLARRKKR